MSGMKKKQINEASIHVLAVGYHGMATLRLTGLILRSFAAAAFDLFLSSFASLSALLSCCGSRNHKTA